ncbi:MAG: hypothetical protein MUE85_14235 [Microscillaceae bacterium]|jgi:uncharacterized membrane protein YgcG|nr:hypothetical protein [Microscillaceae bacterium]
MLKISKFPNFQISKFPNFQISKFPNFFRHLFLVCLSFSLVFQSCERAEELKPLSDEVVLLQAKNWFERNLKKRALNQTKSNNPLPQARREPDWQKIWQANHRDAPLLEMPLEYDGKHLLGKSQSEWGSRLGVTRLLLRRNEDGTFKPIIMRIFADSTYLSKNANQFDYNTFKNQESDFTGEILFYDWEENYLGANRYQNGQITHYSQVNTNKNQIYCIEVEIVYWQTNELSSVNSEITGRWVVRLETQCWFTYGDGGGGGSSGSSGSGGSSGGSAGSGGFDPYCIECGGGGNEGGNGVTPTYEPSSEFASIFNKNKSNLDEYPYRLEYLDKHFSELYKESCIFRAMVKAFTDANRQLGWNYATLKSSYIGGSYTAESLTIDIDFTYFKIEGFSEEDFKNSGVIKDILFEELFHAYQHLYDKEGYEGPADNTGLANKEFEAKFMHDLIERMTPGIKPTFKWPNLALWTYDSNEYQIWLTEMTAKGTKFPSSFAQIEQRYNIFLKAFYEISKNTDSNYGKYPLSTTYKPNALFNLITKILVVKIKNIDK